MRLVISIIRKDWFEYRKPVILLTAGMFIPLFVSKSSADFSKGMMAGLLVSASYGYAYSCFMSERQRGTLQLLLSLPVRPFDLVLAKYSSLYSMALFTANLPGVFLRDWSALFLINAFALLLSTVCMAATVISDKPWAAMIPVWIVLVVFLPIQKLLERYYPDGLSLLHLLTSQVTLLAVLAIFLVPLIAVSSAIWFQWRNESA